MYGIKGQLWLESLPIVIQEAIEQYKLNNLRINNNLSYNIIFTGFQETHPIVLKIGFDQQALAQEAIALKAYDRNGSIGLLGYSDNFLLLEQANPGQSLETLFPQDDLQSIDIFLDIMTKLHKAKIQSDQFPSLYNWLDSFQKPRAYLDLQLHQQKALPLTKQLMTHNDSFVLLHGDLHQNNILSHRSSWVAIDPKGVIGPPIFELAAFIHNPISILSKTDNFQQIIKERIAIFSKKLNVSEQLIRNWCYLQSVLAWSWAIEDKTDEVYFRQLAYFYNLE